MSAELVHLAQGGDRRAFETLAADAIDRLYVTASLILHDRTLAEDAVQETLVRAWRSIRKLRDADRYDAWLRQVLVHACMDCARAERHRRTEQELPATLADPDDLETDAVERDAVARAFASLSADHRAAFVLRHYYGHSVQEVADALHVPLGTAKSRIHYAEQAMARVMDADTRWATAGSVA
jgi:RNA polymerase sigma-70 factor (ECF subfamily)